MIQCDSIEMQCFDDLILHICFEENIAAFYSECFNSEAFFPQNARVLYICTVLIFVIL